MLSIEEIKLLIEKLKVLKRKNFNVLIDENLKVLENLHEALEKNEWNLARPSKKSRSWFIKDLEYKKENPYVNELLANLIQKKYISLAGLIYTTVSKLVRETANSAWISERGDLIIF